MFASEDFGPLGPRRLDAEADAEFDSASRMAQIFSGVMFGALSCYLIFSNSTRMSYIQKASLEKRLNVCCQINTIVAAISCFLNFFQITEVDNWMLPGNRNFTVDVARPIEWILTCPLMQLSLVLMGGSRIPEYRRVLMPAFAVVVLLFGSATLFVDEPVTLLLWGCGLCTHSCAMYFNRLQILEHSRGMEGLLSGDSEFRKATLILIGTWFPFPAWYILSPEGVGLIKDITVVQMGWAFLNITSKFTLIFYLQRIKDNYCNRLKVTREMKGASDRPKYEVTDDDDEEEKKDVTGEVRSCVMETMNFLGMAENVERFLRLLRQAKLYTLEDVARLQPADCDKLQLPFDLVRAVQKRHRVWALEMVDDAEKGLEAGEKHYELAAPKKPKKPADSGNAQTDTVVPVGAMVPVPPFNRDNQSPRVPPGYLQGLTNQQQSVFEPAVNGFSNLGFNLESPDPRGANTSSPWATPFAFDSMGNTRSEQLDQKMLNQLEDLLDRKLERVIEAVGRKIEQSEEGLDMRIKKSEEMLKDSVQEVAKAMEQSQNLLESKIEQVRTSVSSQNQPLSPREQVRTDLWNTPQQSPGLMQQSFPNALQQQSQLQLAVPSFQHAQDGSSQALQRRMDEAVLKLELISNQLGGSVNQMTNGWTQQIEMKMSGIGDQLSRTCQEQLSRRDANFNDSIRSKIESVLSDCMQAFCAAAAQQMHGPQSQQMQPHSHHFSERNGSNMEVSVTFSRFEQMEHNLMRAQKDMNEECEKNISMGIGVVGNSLRLQLDNMATVQQSQYFEAEKMLKSLLERMQEQSEKDAEKMRYIEMGIRECADRALRECADKVSKSQMQELRQFQNHMEEAMREQVKATEKTNQVITSALAGGGGFAQGGGHFDRNGPYSGQFPDRSPSLNRSTSLERGSPRGEGLFRDGTGALKWGSRPGRSYRSGTGST